MSMLLDYYEGRSGKVLQAPPRRFQPSLLGAAMTSDTVLADTPTFAPHPPTKRIDKPFQDLTGRHFGELVVLGYAGQRHRKPAWWCRCDCGAQKIITNTDLTRGKTVSCGCHSRRQTAARSYKHGMSQRPEYQVWAKMIERCHSARSPNYKDYGGRGIQVCSRWRGDFLAFLTDVGDRPAKFMTIERINNDAGYEPGNVRWATRREQTRNQRSNHIVVYQGRAMILADWAEQLGIQYGTLQRRLTKCGWSVEKAFTEPVR